MILLYVLTCLGCGSDPEGSFLDDLATATCDRAQECDPEAFNVEWDSYAACIDEAGVLGTCWSEGCGVFDANQTEDAIQAVRGSECSSTPVSMMSEALSSVCDSCDGDYLVESCGDYTLEFGW
ncbi:MAG: hypothetical protein JXB39_05585 [Deltaproteobacteria bacterium]|nr:hypothetical protein [Deltaproteobacteria bacterium]